ncbi:MAG TPA: DNA alkylation repair protein [Epsilonproteobacteria bacterium]|nr:DNA alkylation repair protein [Campylobacterota bacterium]
MPASKTEKFSLKDELFNPQKVEKIAREIQEVYPSFDTQNFIQETLKAFSTLELKERIYHIRDMLYKYLPTDYQEAVSVLLEALPPELDNSKTDDDFGDFIYAPYSEYVTTYGCNEEHLDFSLEALRTITKRFSVEFAIRDFINIYPKATLKMLESCAKSTNYHERRLASEALRPRLPWAKKLEIDYTLPLRHLELLYADKTRYVTRSVANHLNDISKRDAALVIEILKRWQKNEKQTQKEMAFITNHALRTLVKQGNQEALAFLGYVKHPAIRVKQVKVMTSIVHIGEALVFEVEIEALEEVALLVDYVVHFCTRNGTRNIKVHKLKKLSMKKGEQSVLKKRHPFRANMTTRKLYAGEHLLEIQINGTIVNQVHFTLKA